MEFLDLSQPLTEVEGPVLVVVAHPDDIDFGTAGTVAALTTAGHEVVYRLCTSGEAGPPEEMDRAELKELRENEQRKAAKAVGVTDVEFLGMPDGHLQANLELRKVITRAIRQVRPQLVITQNPERRWDRIFASHPDHLAVAEATMSAVYPDARNPHAHVDLLEEGWEPHKVPEVWIGGLAPLDVCIDITDVFDQKVAALTSHMSQVKWITDVDKLLREWAAATTKDRGLPGGRLTEAFGRVRTV